MNVSICIPAYNCERYIETCINSCLDQNYSGTFEIIVCDDCSTDHTATIISELYKDSSNVRLIMNAHNSGVGASRSKAISHAKGRLIFILDADDYIHPSTLTLLVATLELRPDIDGVFSNYVYVDDSDQKSEMINALDTPIAAAHLYRKSILVKLGLYSSVDIGEDVLFAKKIKESNSRLLHLPLPLYRYRQHELSITSIFAKNRLYDRSSDQV